MPNNGTNNRPLSKEALAAIPVLRSLIISEKGTSTLKRILNDYCREEGEPLPFRKFGFPSAVEYLKATDEFVLRTHMGETTIFVKPKADTAHIQKMVAAQKPAKVQPKKSNVYHWKNPQLRFSSQTGYMSKPAAQPKNPNNPLKRFFPTNSNCHYPKISTGNENVPPMPSEPPKVVPTVPYAKVVSAVKVEPRETKPVVMTENVVTQQAYVRPMPNYNYPVKRESPLAGLPIPSAAKNPCAVPNQNHLPQNAFANERFVQQAKNTCTVQSQPNRFSTNPFNGNLQCPPGFNYRQPEPAVPAKQFIPSNYNVPPPTYSSNPFRTNYNYQPPQTPLALLQQQLRQTPTPPPPPPPSASASSDQIINLLDQQVQMLQDSVKSFKTTYQQSRVQLQSQLNAEVEMMEAIVRQYQRTVTEQQAQQKAAVERLNLQLELLHATCRVNQLGGH